MTNRTRSLSITLGLSFAITQCLSQNVPTPRASLATELTQTIGISKVKVNYSRPSVKGRPVWGALVPYGYNIPLFGSGNPAPWRAGANENTTITFSHDAKVEGNSVPAGTYGLFFVINLDHTGEVILSKNSSSWGNFFYYKEEDQVRANISVRDNAFTELLTYDFINLTKNSGELVLNWEKKQFPVKIEFATDDIVMAKAKDELRGNTFFSTQGHTSAANYCLTNNVELEQGLKWLDQLALLGSSQTFPVLKLKAELLEKLGRVPESEQSLKDAVTIANEDDINNYGYQLMFQGKHDKAIQMFQLNTQRNPKSANAWDSLGEGYATKGDKENAIKSYKKALTLNPPQRIKESSESNLKKLGAM